MRDERSSCNAGNVPISFCRRFLTYVLRACSPRGDRHHGQGSTSAHRRFRPDKEKTAKFYEETFGFKRVSESVVATRLTDGVVNLTFLQFRNQDDAGDERGTDFVGVHHFGLWVDDIEGTKQEIEANGGKFHPGPSGTPPANAEHKFRDPNGMVFDISTHGWDGAKRD